MAKSKWAKLADHVDACYLMPRNPTNYEGFVLVRYFKKLLSEEECDLAMLVGKKPESTEQIALKMGVHPDEIKDKLWLLAEKGILFAEFAGEKVYYHVPYWVPGIIEYTIGKYFDEETAQMFEDIVNLLGPLTKYVSPDAGAMRVVPVMKTVYAHPKSLTYEQVMTYLDQSDTFSAADCACRTSIQMLGKGCEHPVHDMCVQIGKEAEYYIRTGRGRPKTREEVIEILKKAEDTGCVHSVFEFGLSELPVGQSTFICNCCSCGCAGLRIVKQYGAHVDTRSNYKPKVDPEKCVACGACVEKCPANAVRLGDKLCTDYDAQIEKYDISDNTRWGKAKYDFNYRTRHVVTKAGTAPCKTACPAHVSVQGYIAKANEEKYTEALEVIKRENPFPAVCGRICPHPCEEECSRNTIDEAVAIDAIKMFIADKDMDSKERFIPAIKNDYDKKVAVIGAGPAGLSCAYYLAAEGYKVTVFEKEDILGGMLTMGIPSFRLENDVIDAEIDVIRELGVKFQTGVEIGKDKTIQALRDEGFEAFYVAIGAQQGASLGVPGDDLPGVINGIDFLRSVNTNVVKKLSGNVIVVGGGNVAIDVARAAVRAGADSVNMYCLESEEEMPALPEEREEAIGEGIVINNGWGPKAITSKSGKVTGVEFKKCVSVFDKKGRFSPEYDEKDLETADAATVLLSIGQRIDWGALATGENIETDAGGRVVVDPVSYQTSVKDIFAGGDVVTGPKFAIDAIAMGKQGYVSIWRYLREKNLTIGREREYYEINKEKLDTEGFDRAPRQKPVLVDPLTAKTSFKDFRQGLTEEQIKMETDRCLSCGVAVVDPVMCVGCGVCTVHCKFDAISLEWDREHVPASTRLGLFGGFASYAVKRAGRIAVREVREIKEKIRGDSA